MLRKIAPKAMPGFLCPNLSIKCSLLFVLLGCFSVQAHMPAGSPPLTFVYNPESFEGGDIIEIAFYYGIESDQVPSGTVFHMVHPYSGYDIEPGSALTADLTGSWIGSSHTCTDSIWIDHDNRELHVWITSTEPVSGYGLAVTVGGIEIEIVDVPARQIRVTNTLEVVNMSPNPATDFFRLEATDGAAFVAVEILSVNGIILHQQPIAERVTKLSIRNLPPGIYLIRIHTEEQLIHKRLVITR